MTDKPHAVVPSPKTVSDDLAASPPFTIDLDAGTLFCLIGQLQLALRHPSNEGAAAEIAKNVVVDIAKQLPESAQEVIAAAWSEEMLAVFEPPEPEAELAHVEEGTDNRLQSYEGDVLHAAYMQPVLCDEEMIGVNLLAQDGTIYAHGHMDFATAGEFLAEFVGMLRAGMGEEVH